MLYCCCFGDTTAAVSEANIYSDHINVTAFDLQLADKKITLIIRAHRIVFLTNEFIVRQLGGL